MSSNCLVKYIKFNSSCDATFSNDVTNPQGRLDRLKNALKYKILQMEDQEETIQDLECHLNRVKDDLTQLKKCRGKDESQQSIEIAKHEDKLRTFRDILLKASCNLENILWKMTRCPRCKKCTCEQLTKDGEDDLFRTIQIHAECIRCVRKDLESIQFSNSKTEPCLSNESKNKENKPATNRDRSGTRKPLNIADMETFQSKAFAGVNALEGMKDQLDKLYKIVRNYTKQVPKDYEKCEIEKCEQKFQKLHDEFDHIICALSELLDCQKNSDSDSGGVKNGSGRESFSASAEPDKVAKLRTEQKELQKEICEQKQQLIRVKDEIKEAERILMAKRCQEEELDKELSEDDLAKLRAGIRDFKDKLRELEIALPEDAAAGESCSTESLSPGNVQEINEMITTLQSILPGVIEKFKEENCHMKSTINCLEKCLENKEQTMGILQKTLKLRDVQIDDLKNKLQSLDSYSDKGNQNARLRSGGKDNMGESMQKTKEFEMKIKDEYIATLHSEICELDAKLKTLTKEVFNKSKEVEILQDELLYASSKNFFLNREIDLLEPKLGKMQKYLALCEKTICDLQKELNRSRCEIEELYERVKTLEDELECETERCQQMSMNESDRIKQLCETIKLLQRELECCKGGQRKLSPIRSERNTSESEEEEEEDPCMISQLSAEIKCLINTMKQPDAEKEIKQKICCLDEIIKKAECRQEAFKDKIKKMEKCLDKTVTAHECEKQELIKKIKKEEAENCKNKNLISELNECIKKKSAAEKCLKEKISELMKQLKDVENENECLKTCLEKMKKELKDNNDDANRGGFDKVISDLEAQKSALKARCNDFKSELEKEEKVKKCLEDKIEELTEMLTQKTIQFKQLSQDYKCTSAEAQQAMDKLKDADYRLKCMKAAMKGEKSDDESAEECDSSQRELLEETLSAKEAECCSLLKEVECLQEKLKTVQTNYLSAQANKDCKLARLNREINRLECELDVAEKENCKLRNEIKMLQEEMRDGPKDDECNENEEEGGKEDINSLIREKKELLKSLDELQERLEEICTNNTANEKENKDLREQNAMLRKQLNDAENEACGLKQNYQSIQMDYNELTEKLRCSERKLANFKKLYKKITEESACVENARCRLEKELNEIKNDNAIMRQKLQWSKKQEVQMAKLRAETTCNAEDKMKYSAIINDLKSKVKNLEEDIIPRLEEELMEKDRSIENLKMELGMANKSSQRMRDESMRVVGNTKKYMAQQRSASEVHSGRSPCRRDNCYIDNRDQEHLPRGYMPDHSHYAGPYGKSPYQDIEPRSYSPLPWGCSNVERDNNSPDYTNESGFQSMQPSPTNMSYIDYGSDLQRTASHWIHIPRHMDGQYTTPCRNLATR